MASPCEWKLCLTLPHDAPTFDTDVGGKSLIQIEHQLKCAGLRTNSHEDTALIGRSSLKPESSGWSFRSPFWSIRSDVLLTITYSPAWQALPEFTNRQHSNNCCKGCCDSSDPRDFSSRTYTVQDIRRIDRFSDYEVEGIGKCTAVRLHLHGVEVEAEMTIPEAYQAAWAKHVSRMKESRIVETVENSSDDGPVLTLCVPEDSEEPPLLWKVDVPSQKASLALETISVFDGQLDVLDKQPQTHIYINGFQSWSFTGSVAKGDPQPKSALPDTFSRAFNFGGSPPPSSSSTIDISWMKSKKTDACFYQSDFFTCVTSDGSNANVQPYRQLDERGGPSLVLGWLSQKKQFGVITSDSNLDLLAMHVSCHGQILVSEDLAGERRRSISTDWAYAQLCAPHSYDEEPMANFLVAAAKHNHARPLQNGNLLTGWCSWYVFYERITADILRDNFSQLGAMSSQVQTNVAVVDDGYMSAWGDWDSLKKNSFTDMGAVSSDITANGMRPGLWLAPFAADKHSKVARDHPDWIIRNTTGAAANSAHCGKFFYGLDATNPNVRKHVHEAIRRAVDQWKFNVLKIDFLYAACLEGNGKYDLSLSRAEAMTLALNTIREAAGQDVYLIGCGCPIASAIGYIDAMRVSADTGPSW